MRPRPAFVTAGRASESVACAKVPYMAARVAFIKWLVTFFLEQECVTAPQGSGDAGEALPKIVQVGLRVCLPSRLRARPAGEAPMSPRREGTMSLCISFHFPLVEEAGSEQNPKSCGVFFFFFGVLEFAL